MSIIVDKNLPYEYFSALDELKIDYYKSYNVKELYVPVNTHPDMQIHFLSNNYAIVAPCAFEYYKSVLPESIILQKGKNEICGTYPYNISYNVAKLGKRIVGNLNYTDKILLAAYKEMGYDFINVKQGYTKCNICIVDDNSVITEDEGIYKALSYEGVDVLKISPGNVSLTGFPYGFIGGASGFIDSNTIAFYGDIKYHSEQNLILNFIKSRKVNIKCLLSTKLMDFGSIIYFEN